MGVIKMISIIEQRLSLSRDHHCCCCHGRHRCRRRRHRRRLAELKVGIETAFPNFSLLLDREVAELKISPRNTSALKIAIVRIER